MTVVCRLTGVVAVFFGVLSSAVRGQEQDLAWAVSRAPSDALVAAGVRNVQELQAGIRALAGVAETEMPDLVGKMAENLPPEIDVRGPVAIIVSGKKPGVAVLTRLKDGAALSGEDLGGGIRKMEVKNQPAVFCLKMGSWVAVSDDKDSLAAVASAPARLTLSAQQKAEIGRRSIWALVNAKELAARIPSPKDAASKDALAAVPDLDAFSEWAAGVLGQIRSLTAAGDVKAEGVSLTISLDYVPNSQLAALANAGSPMTSFKAGLPASRRMVLAGWGRLDWAKAAGPMKSLYKPLLDRLIPASNVDARKNLDEMWAIFDQWAEVLGSDIGMVMEPAPAGQGIYRVVETFAIKDPDAYRKLVAKAMPLYAGLMKNMAGIGGMSGARNPAMKMDSDYKQGAETIEGLPVDVMRNKMTFDLPPGAGAEVEKQMTDMMDMMYGPEGFTVRMAVVNRLVVAGMGGKETMAGAIRAARGQSPDLSSDPKVSAALSRLPKEATFAALVSLPNYAHMTMSTVCRAMLSAMMRAGAKDDVPALKEPAPADLVSLSARMAGGTQSIEINVPQSEVRGAISVFKDYGAMMKAQMGAMMAPPEDEDIESEPMEEE